MNSKSKSITVIGAGFKGMMAAYKLSLKGFSVTLIDGSKKLGGVLNSPQWDQMYVDLGCHLFSNQNKDFSQDIINILSNNINKVGTSYASFFNNIRTNDIAIPNFESLSKDEKEEIYKDNLNPKIAFDNPTNLKEYYVNRFGLNTAEWLDQFVEKMYGINSSELDKIAHNQLPFNRIRIFTIEKALKLKKRKWYDDRIAIPQKLNISAIENEKSNSFNEFYPMKGGLNYFCSCFHEILIDRGVKIHLGNQVESIKYNNEFIINTQGRAFKSEYLYWAAPHSLLSRIFKTSIDLKPFIYDVPSILYYFTLDSKFVTDINYIQNFDIEDICFRVSFQHNYADNNIPRNLGLICCEVRTKIGSNIWKTPENYSLLILSEMFKMGVIKTKKIKQSKILKTPSSIKLPLRGYSEKFNLLNEELISDKIFGIKNWDYSKNDIFKQIQKDLMLL